MEEKDYYNKKGTPAAFGELILDFSMCQVLQAFNGLTAPTASVHTQPTRQQESATDSG